MGRKLFAVLVIFGVISFFVAMYLYFFVYYSATLVFDANVSDYKVTLFSKDTAQKKSYTCETVRCTLEDIPPFEYNIRISKPWYISQSIFADIVPKNEQDFIIQLEKQVKTEKISVTKEWDLSKQEKIASLREQNLYYKVVPLQKSWEKVYFRRDGDILKVLLGQKNLFQIPRVSPDILRAQKISQSDDILFQVAKGKYRIFNTNTNSQISIPMEPQIRYAKKSNLSGKYILVTDKGSFLYDITSSQSEYISSFDDIIYLDDYIIGIIGDSQKQKKTNFSITESGDIIVRYNSQSKERKVLYSSDSAIEKIYSEGDKISFESGWSIFELKNFK